jgi:hypothetical protein
MITKDELLRLIDDLSAAEVEELVTRLESRAPLEEPSHGPRPLRREDIVRDEPVMPDDETADELIQTVQRWRSAGAYFR